MNVKCPDHNVALVETSTRYGSRWHCPVEGCTVAWWGSPYTTPADATVRTARQDAHAAFDALWSGPSPVTTRPGAYNWLADALGLMEGNCHIGLFGADQCRRVVDLSERRRQPTAAIQIGEAAARQAPTADGRRA